MVSRILILISTISLFCHLSFIMSLTSLRVNVPDVAQAASDSTSLNSSSNAQAKTSHSAPPMLQPLAPQIVVGLDADMSSGSAESGEAIRRGLVLAIDEINRNGGVLGRRFELMVRDHRGNPGRGIDNIRAFGHIPHLVAVVGGIHTPVALEELETIHRHQLIYLGPWAAGTPVIDNGYDPNYAFRVSVRDEYAGEFLVREAIRMGYQRPGLLLEQTGWGESNERAIGDALRLRGLKPAGVEWFHWGITDMTDLHQALVAAHADVILLVANPLEGAVAIESMAGLPAAQRRPVISHWGITGGGRQFFRRVREHLNIVNLSFLQTFSFIDPPFPKRAAQLFNAYKSAFPQCQSPQDIFSPVGTAHAYELMHLLKLAIEKAGTIDRPAVRDALEHLGAYQGVIRDYTAPFTPSRHDALTIDDFRLARYSAQGAIIPLPKAR